MIYYVLETFGLTERQIPIYRTDKIFEKQQSLTFALFQSKVASKWFVTAKKALA